MFVKWSCGCKGMLIDGDKCWVIDNCDKDIYGPWEPLGVYLRDMKDRRSLVVPREEREKYTEEELNEMVMKTYEPLPYSEVRLLLLEMDRLMRDGYSFRQIQSLISHKSQPIKEGDND
jgi:hypothetical protein